MLSGIGIRNRIISHLCFRKVFLPLFCAAVVAWLASPMLATVTPGEIVPGSVIAKVNPGFDPVNGVSVVFSWSTLHLSNSVVIIENPSDYRGNNNTPTRQVANPLLTTRHMVVVDHLPAYGAYSTWGYYVASRQTNGTWATYPGPATAACGNPPVPGCGGSYQTFTLPTSPTHPNGAVVFAMWPIGGQDVYQGDPRQTPACTPTAKNSRECNDLYVALQANLLSGPSTDMVQMQNVVITNLDTGQQVVNNSISAQYLCDLTAPSSPPPANWDGHYGAGKICYNGTLYSINTTLRLRVNSQAVPGHYQFSAKFQAQTSSGNDGNPVVVTYKFTVLPTASLTPAPPSTFPAIAGLADWQNNMANPVPYQRSGKPYRSGEWWCTNNTDTNPWWSLDNGNFIGYFDMPSSIYFEAWNYDGGRVYQQIADYDYNVRSMPGYGDRSRRNHWERCAELAMEPYKDMNIATQGSFVQEPNQFPYGMEMNYLRTGDSTMKAAVDLLARNPVYRNYYAGSAYACTARTTAYMMDDRLADEIAGATRNNAFLPRTVDVLLGILDQTYNWDPSNSNQQTYDIHPFQVGLVMEALINYYELDLAEGNTPDARIPLEIKKVLDWWEAQQYIPANHTLAYQPYDLPVDPTLLGGALYGATSLNDLVAPAYAWYWSKTGNSAYMLAGDDLFNHTFDDAGPAGGGLGGGWTWSVKEFNQIYKWSFDYVRWRTGQNPDGSPAVASVLAAANPCETQTAPCVAPWTDWTTPVQIGWKAAQGPGQYPSVNLALPAPVVTANGATFTFNTFKPATTTIYYGRSAPPACNLGNPAPPYCMQPFPNFGFSAMLGASYVSHSNAVNSIKNNNTANQYDPIGAPNIYNTTVTITGLTPGTTYHWRPLVVDSNGNAAAYADQTFTTASGSGPGGGGSKAH